MSGSLQPHATQLVHHSLDLSGLQTIALDYLLGFAAPKKLAPGVIESVNELLVREASCKAGIVRDSLVSACVSHIVDQALLFKDLSASISVRIDGVDASRRKFSKARSVVWPFLDHNWI